MAYGTPAVAGRDPALLHRHPARTPADRRAARRSHPPLRRDRRPLAARRAHRGPAPRRASTRSTQLAPGDVHGRARAQARRSRRSRRPSTDWPPAAPTHVVGAVLAPHYSALSVGQYLGRARRRRRPLRAVPATGIQSWAIEPAFVDFLAGELRRALAARCPPTVGSCSPPIRYRRASSRPATRTRTSCGRRPRRSPSRGRARGRAVGARLAERRAHARAVADARHPRDHRSSRRRPDGRRRGRVRLRLRRRSSRGAVRPRHRSPPAGRVARSRASTAPRCVNDDPAVMAALAARIHELADPIAQHERSAGARRRWRHHRSRRRRPAGRRRRRSTSSCGRPIDRLGGKIATSPFGGLAHVDEGADAYLAPRPARRCVRPQGRAGERRRHVADRRHGDGLVRRHAPDPRRDRARRSCLGATVRHDLAAELDGQAAGRRRAVAAAHRSRRLDRCVDPGTLR